MRKGASGTCGAGVPDVDADQPPAPKVLVARTWTWWAVPFVRPVTVALVAVPGSASPVSVVQLPQVGLVAHVSGVAVQARYCTFVVGDGVAVGGRLDPRHGQDPECLAVRVGAAGASGFCGAGMAAADDDQAPDPAGLDARTCTW